MNKVRRIGDATLYLGDCLDILPTLASGSVHVIWTDPPYGNNNNAGDLNSVLRGYRDLEEAPILNDDRENMERVVSGMLKETPRLLDKDGVCCVCCAGGGGRNPSFAWMSQLMDKDGLAFANTVIWDKKNPGLGWRYRRQHEMVLIAHRDDGKMRWQDKSRAVGNIYTRFPSSIRVHPNEKPVEMVGYFLELHSFPGDMVIDPFMGSGTTGVSALRLGRQFIGIELSPEHFETSCRRIEAAYEQPDLFLSSPPPPVSPGAKLPTKRVAGQGQLAL